MQARSVLYLWCQLMVSFTRRTAWSVVWGILLALFTVLLAAWIWLLALGKVEETHLPLLIAVTRSTAQTDLGAFYEQSRAWPEVRQVRYVFPEQAAQSDDELPSEARQYGYFELQLREEGDHVLIETRLGAQASWLRVIPQGHGFFRRLWQDRPGLHPFIFGGLTLLFLAVLAVFYIAFRRLARDWLPEFELLKLSGLSSRTLALPFVLAGLLSGAMAAVGAAVLANFAPLIVRRVGGLTALLPELRNAPLSGELGLAALLIGLGLSLLAGLMGLIAAGGCLRQLSLAGPSVPKLMRAKAQEAAEPQHHEEDLQRLERQ